MSIDDLGGGAKGSLTTSLADTLKLINNVGSYQATAEAIGGVGIETISAILNTHNLSDITEIDKLLSAIAKA